MVVVDEAFVEIVRAIWRSFSLAFSWAFSSAVGERHLSVLTSNLSTIEVFSICLLVHRRQSTPHGAAWSVGDDT